MSRVSGSAANPKRHWSFPEAWRRADGPRRDRCVDVLDVDGGVAYEAKVGFKTLSPHIRDQVDRDVALLLDPSAGVQRVEWHFYPSAVTRDVGPSSSLMDYLGGIRPGGARAPRIPFYVHMPPTPASEDSTVGGR